MLRLGLMFQSFFDEGQEVIVRTRSFTIIDSDEKCNEKHEARYRNKNSRNGTLPIRVKNCQRERNTCNVKHIQPNKSG